MKKRGVHTKLRQKVGATVRNESPVSYWYNRGEKAARKLPHWKKKRERRVPVDDQQRLPTTAHWEWR